MLINVKVSPLINDFLKLIIVAVSPGSCASAYAIVALALYGPVDPAADIIISLVSLGNIF